MTSKSALSISLLVFALCAPLAVAKVSKEEAERLGEDLTPLGAEVAGEGDVPAWTGGLTGVPKGIKFDPKTEHPPNPFPDDKIKYTITRQNMAEYDALLTDGHKAMLKRVPGFKMNVYQSRRSCTVPKFVQEATKRNATKVKLTSNGEGVTGGIMGTPFPIPKSAIEMMWNNRLKYVPHKTVRYLAARQVGPKAELGTIKYKVRTITRWTDPANRKIDDLKGIQFLDVRKGYTPERFSGAQLLVHEPIDGTALPRVAWLYTPFSRRVRRAPDASYDGQVFNIDEMSTADSVGGFNGAFDRYDWTLMGRAVRLIPYNSYAVANAKFADLLQPNYLNADLVRYESHRVWAVQAKLREGQKHVYERRVLHLDEDTYSVVAGELYDSRGKLWRVQELHLISYYEVPVCHPVAELVYDLQKNGHYFASSLVGEEKPAIFGADELKDVCFRPESLRTCGVRGGCHDIDSCDSY